MGRKALDLYINIMCVRHEYFSLLLAPFCEYQNSRKSHITEFSRYASCSYYCFLCESYRIGSSPLMLQNFAVTFLD